MVAKISVVSLGLFAALSSAANAGVEPSPFKRRELPAVVEQIVVRLDVIPTRRDVDATVLRQTAELRAQLVALEGSIAQTRGLRVVGNVVELMDSISAAMISPPPELPALQATLDVLGRLAAVAFNPQPEPPAYVAKALGLMDRIAAVAFNPQPEPPARAAGIAILDRITAVAFNPQPEPPAVIGQVVEVLDKISAVMFNPQPEPPARATVAAMLETITLMGSLGTAQR